jgi:DNA helicase-4
MHKSKGITRDIVIVLNMTSRANGMPATKPSDPLLELLLAPMEDFAFAEERRLFYVALTRAREQTFLIADAKHPSPFVLELNDELRDIYGARAWL